MRVLGLASSEAVALSVAAPALEAQHPGLVERIEASPYLSLFPPSLEDPGAASPAHMLRFRDPVEPMSSRPLPSWWPDDDSALVYVTFGSVAGSMPIAGALYAHVLEALSDVGARVLLTILGALGAGSPLVVVPLFADQPENARRVAAVGAGLAVEPHGEDRGRAIWTSIDPAGLREAVHRVLSDETYAKAARAIAAEMHSLPATDHALSMLAEAC